MVIKAGTILLSFVLTGVILVTLFLLSDHNRISMIEEESYFQQFFVKSSTVHFEYSITLDNEGNVPKAVQITANLKQDYENGLINEPQLTGINKANGVNSFIVPPNTRRAYHVEFIGDFSGNYCKPSKVLPELIITEIDNDLKVEQ